MLVRDHRLSEGLGLPGPQHGLVTLRGTALDLLHGLANIPERCRHDGNQSLRIFAAPIDEKVVVGAHALEHELGLLQPQETPRTEPAEVGIEDLGVDALFVHQREAGLGVVGARRNVVVAVRDIGEAPVEARHGVEAGAAAHLVADHPKVAPVDFLDVGDEVAPFARHARRPHVGGLGDMRVGVDDLEPIEDALSHALPSLGWRRLPFSVANSIDLMKLSNSARG